ARFTPFPYPTLFRSRGVFLPPHPRAVGFANCQAETAEPFLHAPSPSRERVDWAVETEPRRSVAAGYIDFAAGTSPHSARRVTPSTSAPGMIHQNRHASATGGKVWQHRRSR